jgi:uncharacterized protein YdeI (YjbR/CyaY-like superfamily)
MSPTPLKTFKAVLEPLQSDLGWVVVRIPFDVPKAWPVRNRLRVKGSIEGFAFRTSLFAYSGGEGHFLLVNKKMQEQAKARVGTTVRFQLEPDLEERPATAPPELAGVMKRDRNLRRWFDKLSPSMRREIAKWVSEPKSAESRINRAEKMAERMMLAMEGEAEPPPILRAAFLRQPQAREGWEAMTPVQRRNHLLGIFHSESAEARERRAAKVVAMALQVAAKKRT